MSTRPAFNLLSVVAGIERQKIGSGEPFLLLMDIAYPGGELPSQQQHQRLVRNVDPVTFDAGDGLGPQEYQEYNFSVGDFAMGTDGKVPESEIVASNVMRALQGVIAQYAGAVGADLNLYVVNAANLAGEPDLALSFTIKDTTCDAKLVHFKLGATSPLRRNFPLWMYRPNYCIWDYNSPMLQAATAAALAAGTPLLDPPGAQCGYQGSMPTCSKTIDGPTGCLAHDNVVRIGTFPGIDTNGAAIASVA